MTNKPYPVLKTVTQDNYAVESCGHEDVQHLNIRRFTSVKNPGMYWAIEYERCKICNTGIRKVWYTPYKDYVEGIKAYNETPEAKEEALLGIIYELLELVDHLVMAPPIANSDLEEVVLDGIARMKDKVQSKIDG